MVYVSELSRERETYKFVSPPFELARDHPTASAATSGVNIAHDDPAATCSDTALNAFVQLGAFKFGAARCLISVFDRKNQYVVAEATQTTSIAVNEISRDLWLGGSAIPRMEGVCEHVLATNSPGDMPVSAELPISVVPNLALDARFCDRPCVLNLPHHRFYAGIPIRSPRGINIGVFSIFDDKPRDALDASQLQFLQTISSTVMEHWSCRASATNFRQSERMVRGLGSFVEGKATISSWQADMNTGSFSNKGAEGHLNQNQQSLEEHQDHSKAPAGDSPPQRPDPTPLQSGVRQGDSDSTVKKEEVVNSDDQLASGTPTATMSVDTSISAFRTNTALQAEEPMIKAVQDVFSRAANIIREAVEIEGVLFLDASIGTFAGLVADHDSNSSSSSVPSTSTILVDTENTDTTNEEDAETKLCGILGYSTSTTSSIDDKTVSQSHEAMMPEEFLRSLLRRYPGGKVFSFDEGGHTQATDEDSEGIIDETATPKPSSSPTEEKPGPTTSDNTNPFSKKNEANAIISMFPEARCVALVPLWDTRKERWFAGSFLWTKTLTRRFTPTGELSYLRAFGATIMAEITRLDSALAQKATSDLLGSLSHELRSPLHGVVAAVELLQDTDIDAFQGNLLHSMESCGRTMLESIDHLLDYTKINRLVKDQRLAGGRGPQSERLRSFESQMTNFSSTVELGTLAEETVESIFAGHNFHRMSIAQLIKNEKKQYLDVDSLRRLDSAMALEALSIEGVDLQTLITDQDAVSVYLDIDPRVPWQWHITPGAVRRIIMNLLGNSLKFTKRGYIVVTLRQEQVYLRSRRGQVNLKLDVLDSGKGISPDFLHHRAFKPFSQEDALSPGTGLGLSIVHQITKSLGGSVQIESQLQRGTFVSVTLPLQIPQADLKINEPFHEHVAALRGLRVALVGLDELPEAPGLSTHIPPIEAHLVESICQDWLLLELISPDINDVLPDLIICTDSSLAKTGPATPSEIQPPTVVICRNALAAHSLSERYSSSYSYGKGIFEFISQPAGPRKLASAMMLALGRFNDSKASELIAIRTSVSSQSTSEFSSIISSPTPTPMTEQMTPILDQVPPKDGSSETVIPFRPWQPDPEVPNAPRREETAIETPEEAEVTVSITPATPISSATPQASTPGTDTEESKGRRYLLVDDNNINLKILASFMRKLNYSYKTATNGLEALEAYSSAPEKYAYILMDISMPVMDGLEATQRIRELEKTQKLKPVPIIALTGLASADAQKEAFASGIDLYMTKPVRFKELAKVLAKAKSDG